MNPKDTKVAIEFDLEEVQTMVAFLSMLQDVKAAKGTPLQEKVNSVIAPVYNKFLAVWMDYLDKEAFKKNE